MNYRKKLIEVALPLEAINDASAYDKMPGIGPHPKGMHHWWARLPLPTARAILFASLVDDPSSDPKWADKSELEQDQQRQQLFLIIRKLLQKKIHDNPDVFNEANRIIKESCNGLLPNVLDPFSGGGSIPLEAQRLGLPSNGSDLNPVAVLITRASIEILPRFAKHKSINPDAICNPLSESQLIYGSGIAADLRYYANKILNDARRKIGHLYPKGQNGEQIIAWIWARTVESTNPICQNTYIPLVNSYMLSSKKNGVWIEPIVDRNANSYSFEVRTGVISSENRKWIDSGTKVGRGCKFKCLISGDLVSEDHIKNEGFKGNLGLRLMAMVGEGKRCKTYLSPTRLHEETAIGIQKPSNLLDVALEISPDKRAIWCLLYVHLLQIYKKRR